MLQLKEAKESCRGCSFGNSEIFCAPLEYGMDQSCPCIECLVKVMCDSDSKGACPERAHFVNTEAHPKSIFDYKEIEKNE